MSISSFENAPRRVASIDVLRGLVMVIMAIDHVRVYSGVPAGAPEAGIFFTRWITHFCAPTFAFLAGTSAFLFLAKTRSLSETRNYLLTRGALLVLLELTFIRFAWTSNLDFGGYTLAGVIWMLGWCMILLTPFVGRKPMAIAAGGLLIVFGQQLFSHVPALFPETVREPVTTLWSFFYPTGSRENALSGTSGLESAFGISILYVLIPWIGVMMCGYGFGALLLKDGAIVKRTTLSLGLLCIFLFVLIAGGMAMASTDTAPFYYKLFNQRKYPASQLYLLMTLGPVIALVPWAETAKGTLVGVLKSVGRVPMFFYLLHIPVIHISAILVNVLVYGVPHNEWYTTAPLVGVPEADRWPLALLYLVWLIDTALIVYLSQQYARFKAANPHRPWLKYI